MMITPEDRALAAEVLHRLPNNRIGAVCLSGGQWTRRDLVRDLAEYLAQARVIEQEAGWIESIAPVLAREESR